jgi:RNA binding exosome subunit
LSRSDNTGAFLIDDNLIQFIPGFCRDEFVTEVNVFEHFGYFGQNFQVLAGRVFRRKQKKKEMHRFAVERIISNALFAASESNNNVIQI